MELAWTGSSVAPLAQLFAAGGVFENPGVAVAIGDEEMAIRREGDVCRPVEIAFSLRLAANGNLHQLFALRRELVYQGAPCVHGPDVFVASDAYVVRYFDICVSPV